MNNETLSATALSSWYPFSFSLNVNMTDVFFNKINTNIKFYSFWLDCLNKFRNAEWGNITKEDWELNNLALKDLTYKFIAIYKNSIYGDIVIESDFKNLNVSLIDNQSSNIVNV